MRPSARAIRNLIYFLIGVAIGALIVVDSAYGQGLYLDATMRSFHADRAAHYNEHNPGLGLEYQFSPTLAVAAGEYRNSFNDSSHYYGVIYTPWNTGGWKFGAIAGCVTGYTAHCMLMAIPVVEYEYKRVGFNFIVSPWIVAAQLKFKLF